MSYRSTSSPSSECTWSPLKGAFLHQFSTEFRNSWFGLHLNVLIKNPGTKELGQTICDKARMTMVRTPNKSVQILYRLYFLPRDFWSGILQKIFHFVAKLGTALIGFNLLNGYSNNTQHLGCSNSRIIITTWTTQIIYFSFRDDEIGTGNTPEVYRPKQRKRYLRRCASFPPC